MITPKFRKSAIDIAATSNLSTRPFTNMEGRSLTRKADTPAGRRSSGSVISKRKPSLRTGSPKRRRNPRITAAIFATVRGRFDAAKLVEDRHPALDVRAHRLRCQGAMYVWENFDAIKAECDDEGISIGDRCRIELGCGITLLKMLRKLWQRFDIYETKRLAYLATAGASAWRSSWLVSRTERTPTVLAIMAMAETTRKRPHNG